jgi:hypothetical protein
MQQTTKKGASNTIPHNAKITSAIRLEVRPIGQGAVTKTNSASSFALFAFANPFMAAYSEAQVNAALRTEIAGGRHRSKFS